MIQCIVRDKEQLNTAYDLKSGEIIVKGSLTDKIAKIIWGKRRSYYNEKNTEPLIMNGIDSSKISIYIVSSNINVCCNYRLCIKSIICKMKVLYNILKIYKITYYSGDTMKLVMKKEKN